MQINKDKYVIIKTTKSTNQNINEPKYKCEKYAQGIVKHK